MENRRKASRLITSQASKFSLIFFFFDVKKNVVCNRVTSNDERLYWKKKAIRLHGEVEMSRILVTRPSKGRFNAIKPSRKSFSGWLQLFCVNFFFFLSNQWHDNFFSLFISLLFFLLLWFCRWHNNASGYVNFYGVRIFIRIRMNLRFCREDCRYFFFLSNDR